MKSRPIEKSAIKFPNAVELELNATIYSRHKRTPMPNKPMDKDNHTIKMHKHALFQHATETFLYNIKQFIAIEGTQKKLAQGIGVSEELLSKYKSGDAFPAIETLMVMAERYGLTLDTLLKEKVDPWSLNQNTHLATNQVLVGKEVQPYYLYFFVTNIDRKGLLHEGRLFLHSQANSKAIFEIHSDKGQIKRYVGHWKTSSKMIFMHFNSEKEEEGTASLHFINPPMHGAQYVGGMGLMLLPSDATSKPCAQRVLVSRVQINRDQYAQPLENFLKFECTEQDANCFEKINASQDERAYVFIRKVEHENL